MVAVMMRTPAVMGHLIIEGRGDLKVLGFVVGMLASEVLGQMPGLALRRGPKRGRNGGGDGVSHAVASTAVANGRAAKVIHIEEAITTQIYPGITMDPGVRFGKPCVAGTRVDVATVAGAIGAGDGVEDVQEAYGLSRDQVLAAVRYAAHVAAHLPPAVQEVS